MSMSDPIADLLTRIRNAQMVSKATVRCPSSKGEDCHRPGAEGRGLYRRLPSQDRSWQVRTQIALKYYAGRPVIERIERVSRPGLRVYKGRDSIPQVMNGLGVALSPRPRA